jgi:hypothetical protein
VFKVRTYSPKRDSNNLSELSKNVVWNGTDYLPKAAAPFESDPECVMEDEATGQMLAAGNRRKIRAQIGSKVSAFQISCKDEVLQLPLS